ncbi:MAG: hypothetical protein AAB956_03700 [Patescibacteria group bacterium]
MSNTIKWKVHLDYYDHLRALAFQSKQELHLALELLESDALRSLPFDLVANRTIIVPQEAVPFFQEANLQFDNTEVLTAADLPPAEIAQLRREQGPY